MDELERIERWQLEVDERRAAFLNHVADCEECHAALRRDGPGDVRCAVVARLVREYDAAHELLAEALAAARL